MSPTGRNWRTQVDDNREKQISLELAKKLANLDINNEAFIERLIALMHVTGATPWQQDQLEVALRVIFNIQKNKSVPPVW